MDYKKAGVDIEAGYKSVELMKKTCTRNNATGSSWRTWRIFRCFFHECILKDMEEPTLVSGTDGCRNQSQSLPFVHGQT